MCNCVNILPPNRFAVAREAAPTRDELRPAASGAGALSLASLAEAEEQAWAEWLRLFCEPDCWSDPQNRAAMLRARRRYQDASIAKAEASRRQTD